MYMARIRESRMKESIVESKKGREKEGEREIIRRGGIIACQKWKLSPIRGRHKRRKKRWLNEGH